MNTKTKTKKERSDKLKNRAKVIKATLKNPLKSQREIAKEQWVSDRTVWRVQAEMSQNVAKDDRIILLSGILNLQLSKLNALDILEMIFILRYDIEVQLEVEKQEYEYLG